MMATLEPSPDQRASYPRPSEMGEEPSIGTTRNSASPHGGGDGQACARTRDPSGDNCRSGSQSLEPARSMELRTAPSTRTRFAVAPPMGEDSPRAMIDWPSAAHTGAAGPPFEPFGLRFRVSDRPLATVTM